MPAGEKKILKRTRMQGRQDGADADADAEPQPTPTHKYSYQPSTQQETHDDDDRPWKRVKTRHIKTTKEGDATRARPSHQHIDIGPPTSDDGAQGMVIDPIVPPTHEVGELSVTTSSQVHAKVRQVLLHLARFSLCDVTLRPVIVRVRAEGAAVSKAVSIVEMVKSELDQDGSRWFQYSAVQSQRQRQRQRQRIQLPSDAEPTGPTVLGWEQGRSDTSGLNLLADPAPTPTPTGKRSDLDGNQNDDDDDDNDDDGDDDDDEDAFQSMQALDQVGGRQRRFKLRTLPRLLIYLTRVPCPPLEEVFGYDVILTSFPSRSFSPIGPG